MERKLASIQRITKLEPILEADSIEKATILGWEVVVKKGEFNEGDLVIYCEIDSILPDRPEFEFLRDRKFRIKTIKLKKQISQGICFPLSVLPSKYLNKSLSEGFDVTEMLGVIKYETKAEKAERELQIKKANRVKRFLSRYSWYRRIFYKASKSDFPKFIRKTDEDRVQLFPDICTTHKEVSFTVTEKLDGQSGTYFIIKNKKNWFELWKSKYYFGVCSRNYLLHKPDNSNWWKIARQLDIKNKLLEYVKKFNLSTIIIQGEIIGEGIQGNKYKINGLKFYLFDVYEGTVIRNRYRDSEIRRFANNLGLDVVPLINPNYTLPESISEIVNYSKGESRLHHTKREGLVMRNYSKDSHTISFKVINPEFLLETEKDD